MFLKWHNKRVWSGAGPRELTPWLFSSVYFHLATQQLTQVSPCSDWLSTPDQQQEVQEELENRQFSRSGGPGMSSSALVKPYIWTYYKIRLNQLKIKLASTKLKLFLAQACSWSEAKVANVFLDRLVWQQNAEKNKEIQRKVVIYPTEMNVNNQFKVKYKKTTSDLLNNGPSWNSDLHKLPWRLLFFSAPIKPESPWRSLMMILLS